MASWGDLPEAVHHSILGIVATAALATTVAMVSKACRSSTRQVLAERLREEKDAITRAAGGPSDDNNLFFMFALHMISLLRTHGPGSHMRSVPRYFLLHMHAPMQGAHAQEEGDPILKYLQEVPRNNLDTFIQNRDPRLVIGCRSPIVTWTVCQRFARDEIQKYQRYCQCLPLAPLLTKNDSRTIYTLPFKLREGAISVRIKRRELGQKINAVRLSFLVCSRQEVQEVQGLLLTIGEDSFLGDFPDPLKELR